MQNGTRTRGFTLIEIMVVVVIIGLLAGFAGPQIWRMFAHGQEDIAAERCQQMHNTVKMYMNLNRKSVPSSLQDLEDDRDPNTGEPWLRLDKDPWGNEYWLDKIEGRRFRIVSNGPDGTEGTEDDIYYPRDDEG